MFRAQHTVVHRLMRRLRLGRYAIFPGPDWETLAVYVYGAEPPRCLLVRQVYWYIWPDSYDEGRRERLEQSSHEVIRLRQEAGALVERLGCAVASVLLLHTYRKVQHFNPLLEVARQQETAVFFPDRERLPDELIWLRPPMQHERPPLPPFPKGIGWATSTEPDRWLRELQSLAEADDRKRKSQAQSLTLTALEFLKETPARFLLEGPDALAPVPEILNALPDALERFVGRRYLLWTGFYLSLASLIGLPDGEINPGVIRFVNYLLEHFERWSTRERRVIVRGLEWLTRRSAELAIPPDTGLGQLLSDLFPRLIRIGLEQCGNDWKFEGHFDDLAEALADGGYLPPQAWLRGWQQQRAYHKLLESAYRGLIGRLIRAPSPDLWRMAKYARTELGREPYLTFRWHLYDSNFAPAFWELAAQDEVLLGDLVMAATDILDHPTRDTAPSREALQRIVELMQGRLESVQTSGAWRERFTAALPRLVTAIQKTHPPLQAG